MAESDHPSHLPADPDAPIHLYPADPGDGGRGLDLETLLIDAHRASLAELASQLDRASALAERLGAASLATRLASAVNPIHDLRHLLWAVRCG